MKHSPPILREKDRTAGFILHSKIASGIGFLILFLSPTQLGYHFWPTSAFVGGVRVDYLSPAIYLLDLLILAYIVLQRGLLQRMYSAVPVLLPLLLINLLISNNSLATLSWIFHFCLYLIFALSLSPRLLGAMWYLFPFSMLFQVVLGAFQVLRGSSVQGLFYWFGERALSVGAPGVAKTEFLGEVILRAYGTFSHPNILAGWLVLSTLIVARLSTIKEIFPRRHVVILSSLLTSVAIILTQSRAAAISLFGLVLPFFVLRSLASRLIYFSFLFIITAILLITPPSSRSHLSVSERLSLQKVSLQTLSHYPLFGTGANAAISTYPHVSPNLRLFQPDHNSFTLFLSWLGIIGTFSFILILGSNQKWFAASLLPIFPILLFDHYLLTSPQGLFILILYLRLQKLST